MKRREEDHDEEQENELHDEDEDATFVISKVSDVLHAMFGTYKEGMIPYFESLLPQMNKLSASKFYGDRQWALCIFDDLIEFGGVVKVMLELLRIRDCGKRDFGSFYMKSTSYVHCNGKL